MITVPALRGAAGNRRQTIRLVVVENDDNDALFLERALQKTGFTHPLTRLADGQSAIDYFSALEFHARPDAILLDLKMPRKSGFDVLQWLRGDPSYVSLPIIMLSSSDEPIDVRKAEDMKATRFLRKKSAYKELIESLEQLLLPLD